MKGRLVVNYMLVYAILFCLLSVTTPAQLDPLILIRRVQIDPRLPWSMPLGEKLELEIVCRFRNYAMPVFTNQDSMADPTFTFYDSIVGGRVTNCPFYRPSDSTYKDFSGRESNCWRIDSLGVYKPHWGLDIHAPKGTPIVAADTGIVTYAGPFKRGYLGKPEINIDVFYYLEDPNNPFSLKVGYKGNKVYRASIHNVDWSGRYGNVVLVYYPYWNKTIQYSHLQDFEPWNPLYQNIDSSTQYVKDTVYPWETIGYVGRTGYNPGTDTARIHVDIMVYEGKRKLGEEWNFERVPSPGYKVDGINIEDPYPWLYYKSLKGTIQYNRIVEERDCNFYPVGLLWEEELDTFRIGVMAPKPGWVYELHERESGRLGQWSEIIKSYRGDESYICTPAGIHTLKAWIIGHPMVGGSSRGVVLPPPCKILSSYDDISQLPASFIIVPNPFNSSCQIGLSFAPPTETEDGGRSKRPSSENTPTIEIFDMTGRRVCDLSNRIHSRSGSQYTIQWDGSGDDSRTLSSGTYLVCAVLGDRVQTAKVTLLR